MADARIEAAIANWAHRFTANGVPLSDFQKVTGGLESWDDWCGAWSARAAIHEKLGEEALDDGFGLSAGEHFERAGLLFHFAKFLFAVDPVQMKAAHRKAVDGRTRALPHLRPPGERVAIPFEGSRLMGILRRPRGEARPPVVIMCVGLDSTKEEMGTNEANYLGRGMATLAFDGPGQGEAEYEFPLRGDFESAVTAVVDWIETREDLDAARIGVWGVSMGGYFAARAAAFEKRLKACISISGPYDYGPKLKHMPEISQDTFRMRSHGKTKEDAQAVADTLTLKHMDARIDCPLFVLTGANDRITPPENTEKILSVATGPTRFLLIEDAGHVANNRRYCYDGPTSDWMAQYLGAG